MINIGGERGTEKRYWFGRFQKIEDGKIFLKTLDGAEYDHDLDTLTPVALEFAKFLAEKGKEKLKNEIWTSQAGTKLEAAFISLKGEKVTLKLKNGSLSTLPLKRLSIESIARAKELAGK